MHKLQVGRHARVLIEPEDDRRSNYLFICGHVTSVQHGVPDYGASSPQLFNDTWALLQKESWTTEEDDRMIHMAHASRFHWDNVGDDQTARSASGE
jgi:hypothetical protein